MAPFPHVVLVLDPADDPAPALTTLRRLAPGARDLHVLALVADAPAALTAAPTLAAIRAELSPRGQPAVTVGARIAGEPGERLPFAGPTLVVVGPTSRLTQAERAALVEELAVSPWARVVAVGAATPPTGRVAMAIDAEVTEADVADVVARLPFARALHLHPGGPDDDLLAIDAVALSRALGIPVHLAPAAPDDAELLVLPLHRAGVAALRRAFQTDHLAGSPGPTLLTPVVDAPRLAATDTFALPGHARVLVERVGRVLRGELTDDDRLERPGHPDPLPLRDGAATLPVTPGERAAVVRLGGTDDAPALVALLDPAAPVVLVDSTLEAPERLAAAPCRPVFVRMRPDEPLPALRARLALVLPALAPVAVLDASAWLLDDAGADVPREADGVRLLRLAHRLRVLGAAVAAVVPAQDTHLRSRGVEVWSADALPAALAPLPALPDPLTLLSGADAVPGHRVTLELDNGDARRALLAAFAAAGERIHLQSYMVEDDPVSAELVAALEAAGRRGVTVRVIADALYSLHGAFGASNPVLARLARAPNVEVRGARPVTGMPTVIDLKLRNHRKVVVVDAARGWVSGRNLAAAYYLGFDEATLSPDTPAALVPWLDASARIEGPLVADLDRAFLHDWVSAGGGAFPIHEVPPIDGGVTCRLVRHDGLADAHTLDAYLTLVERAREALTVVSTFPLAVELQEALVAALARGVRVDVVFGNVRPRYGDAEAFVGGTYRELGDELVRSRLGPVLRAGAAGWEVALPPRPGWSPALGPVWPHVHAKLLVRDGEDVVVGSANVDITSSYWESEAMLLVHDAAFARATLAALAPFMATARRVEAGSGDWAAREESRARLARYWPALGW